MLDDVLSAVDHENEKKLVQELSNLSSSEKQTTVILVSNRLSAFRFADQIVVFDNGEIIDQGTGIVHEKYMKKNEIDIHLDPKSLIPVYHKKFKKMKLDFALEIEDVWSKLPVFKQDLRQRFVE